MQLGESRDKHRGCCVFTFTDISMTRWPFLCEMPPTWKVKKSHQSGADLKHASRFNSKYGLDLLFFLNETKLRIIF